MDLDDKNQQGQKGINTKVIKQGLCTGCCACVSLCPSMEYYKDKTILVHDCNLEKGRCFAYGPRTPTDLPMSLSVFEQVILKKIPADKIAINLKAYKIGKDLIKDK